MGVEYDLAIVGASDRAQQMAARAAWGGARVVLVAGASRWTTDGVARLAVGLRSLGTAWRQALAAGEVALSEVIAHLEMGDGLRDRLEALQALGVDVVFGSATFGDRRSLVAGNRLLRSRYVALVPDPLPPERAILGGEVALTPDRLLSGATLPSELAITAGNPLGCLLAQALHAMGVRVTLYTSGSCILPGCDRAIALRLQAHLEAAGIAVVTSARITAIDRAGDRLRLWTLQGTADHRAVLHPVLPVGESLPLDRAGVECQGRIRNPRIVHCRHAADSEALLQRLVGWERSPAGPISEATALPTAPPTAWVGLDEREARRHYGVAVGVLEFPLAGGCLKVLCDRRGKLLGAHGIGAGAAAGVSAIAAAQQLGIRARRLAQSAAAVMPCLDFSRAIAQLAALEARQAPWRRAWREAWLTLRRDLDL